ncbi:MAG: Maf family protein [Spirochaetia bacterium]|nr:Maf family protein [Spirochaetia bacterium]
MPSLVLASSSPRRQTLLTNLGLPFSTAPSEYEEQFDDRPPRIQALYLAQQKVAHLLSHSPEHKGALVLGADTCIDVDGKILGKPSDRHTARRYLQQLGGRAHKVITALSLWDGPAGVFLNEAETTTIQFAALDSREIEWYLDTEEWKGAAGAYRIQGRASLFVHRIEGCYFNVMGLPIHRFYGMLQTQGYDLFEIVSP